MPLTFTSKESLGHLPKPLKRSPCANIEPNKQWGCPNEGSLTCSRCLIVGYCSQDCQKKHWRMHKSDCKDPIRSEDWAPIWVVEDRSPTFISNSGSDGDWLKNLLNGDPIALSKHLWGNIPAMDLINLPANESDTTRDISFACIASGDLRNVVRSINTLPPDFSGNLNILLNDREPIIVVRNIILLLILGTIPDKDLAAELALHFWYSAFIPVEYLLEIQKVVLKFVEALGLADANLSASMLIPLGEESSLSIKIEHHVVAVLSWIMQSEYDVMDASKELERVRFAPSRVDRHHRQYCTMEPSHRLAALEFRRFGLVLPYGARNDHFNYPNPSLFSPQGKWLEDDLATPLVSWDITAIVQAGKVHGARRADLYGCLYFYLFDQLRAFSERLGQLHIEIHITCEDAIDLSRAIRKGDLSKYRLPPSIKFDRIEVSNILDADYVGIPGVLEAWGPFLKHSKCATLVGNFMNWPTRQNGANASSATNRKRTISFLVEKLLEKNSSLRPPSSPTRQDMKRHSGILLGHLDSLTALYDNSASFDEYLRKYGLHEALRKGNLKLKERHTIVPHRIGAPIGALPHTLPDFTDGDSWYLNTGISGHLWSERFIEICWA